ncbi:Uncharacterised protein [Mycobacterium tuberculosis]|nr:Uncharacterised protein [Mycobacterium tuberculosis]CKT31928.1 Uncharacterised protein [Mycobacterium tuberculosis]COW24954.1 Uncharacterised protein [Mycobacterium tuberculosis]
MGLDCVEHDAPKFVVASAAQAAHFDPGATLATPTVPAECLAGQLAGKCLGSCAQRDDGDLHTGSDPGLGQGCRDRCRGSDRCAGKGGGRPEARGDSTHRHSPCDGCSNAQELLNAARLVGAAQLSGARSATARLPGCCLARFGWRFLCGSRLVGHRRKFRLHRRCGHLGGAVELPQ